MSKLLFMFLFGLIILLSGCDRKKQNPSIISSEVISTLTNEKEEEAPVGASSSAPSQENVDLSVPASKLLYEIYLTNGKFYGQTAILYKLDMNSDGTDEYLFKTYSLGDYYFIIAHSFENVMDCEYVRGEMEIKSDKHDNVFLKFIHHLTFDDFNIFLNYDGIIHKSVFRFNHYYNENNEINEYYITFNNEEKQYPQNEFEQKLNDFEAELTPIDIDKLKSIELNIKDFESVESLKEAITGFINEE